MANIWLKNRHFKSINNAFQWNRMNKMYGGIVSQSSSLQYNMNNYCISKVFYSQPKQSKILRPKSNSMFKPSKKEPGKFVFDDGYIDGSSTEDDTSEDNPLIQYKITVVICLFILTTIMGYFFLSYEVIELTDEDIENKHNKGGKKDVNQTVINKHKTILKIIRALQTNLTNVILIDESVEKLNQKKRLNKMIMIDNEIKSMINSGLFDEEKDKELINEYKNTKMNDVNRVNQIFMELGLNCYRPTDQLKLINQDQIRNMYFNLSEYLVDISKIQLTLLPPFDMLTFGSHKFMRDVIIFSDKYKEYIRVTLVFSGKKFKIEDVNLIRIDLGNFRFSCKPWINEHGIADISKWIVEVQQKFSWTWINWLRHISVNLKKRIFYWVKPKDYTLWVNLDKNIDGSFNYGKLTQRDIHRNEQKMIEKKKKKRGLWRRWKDYWGLTEEFEERTKGRLFTLQNNVNLDSNDIGYDNLDQESIDKLVKALEEFHKNRNTSINDSNNDNDISEQTTTLDA